MVTIIVMANFKGTLKERLMALVTCMFLDSWYAVPMAQELLKQGMLKTFQSRQKSKTNTVKYLLLAFGITGVVMSIAYAVKSVEFPTIQMIAMALSTVVIGYSFPINKEV